MKKIVTPKLSPQPVGPYHQAVIVGNLVFCSGQIPIDPQTGLLVTGGIEEQTKRVFQNIQLVLSDAGTDLSHLIKTTVFLQDMNDFAQMNQVYQQYIPDQFPARSTIQVARLPKDALIEIEVIAEIV